MSEPFLGEITMFAGSFAPKGWALCNGQLLPITQNTALFSLLGTRYGGDGKTTFALPNLQGRAPLGVGQGPGLTNRLQGQTGGSTDVTLLTNQMPAHTHTGMLSPVANEASPKGNVFGKGFRNRTLSVFASSGTVQMNPGALAISGQSAPHNNMQPYLAVNFIIALQGIFPVRA